MSNTEQQRLLGILKHGIETGSTADAGGIVRSPVSDFTCPALLRGCSRGNNASSFGKRPS